MSFPTYVYRFIVTNILTAIYTSIVSVFILIKFLKGLLGIDPPQKLMLVPPASLADPKYGLHKYIKVNSIKLHYVESGDPSKPLMIFLHGFPEFWYSWRHQILNFNKDYWCVAMDLRGYADSERPDDVDSYNVSLLIEDVRELVKHLGREKFILVAHDWGGLIAAKYRDFYPETLLGVILLASCSLEALHNEMWNNLKQRLKSWYMFFFRTPAIPEYYIQMHSMGDMFRQMMMVKGKSAVNENDIACYTYWFSKQLAFTPPINYYRANFAYYMPEPVMCEHNIPMLVAHAARDSYLSHNLLERMKKQYKHIETTIIEGCSHFLQQEEPEKVNEVIRGFLRKHSI